MSDTLTLPRDRGDGLRVMFAMGVSQAFYEAERTEVEAVIEALREGFADLQGRFGVTPLAGIDDDEIMVGPSTTWPWTCYLIADAPDLDAVAKICNLLREVEVGDFGRLWKYVRIEARVGRPLFFGNE